MRKLNGLATLSVNCLNLGKNELTPVQSNAIVNNKFEVSLKNCILILLFTIFNRY